MLKALNKLTQTEIIPADLYPNRELLAPIRELSNERVIICPHCKSQVILKAGKVKVWHFAHLAKSDCPLSKSTGKRELLIARQNLYLWFKSKGAYDLLTLEYQIPGLELPHLVDCYLEKDGHKHAFYIIETRYKWEDLLSRINSYRGDIKVHLIILLKENIQIEDAGFIHLKRFEEKLITRTGNNFEKCYQPTEELNKTRFSKAGSLYFIHCDKDNINNAELIILRSVYRSPRGYYDLYCYGELFRDQFSSNLLFTAKHGDIVYKGEYEALQKKKKDERAFIEYEKAEEEATRGLTPFQKLNRRRKQGITKYEKLR